MTIERLYEYQEFRKEYFALKNRLENNQEKDSLLKWKKNIETLQKSKDSCFTQIKEKKSELRNIDLSIKDLKEKEKNFEKQLYGGEVSNPKELLSLQQKLDDLAQQKMHAEEEEKKINSFIDEAKEKISELNKKIQEESEPYQIKANKYKQEKEINRATLNKLVVKIKELESAISPELLNIYKKNVKTLGENILAPLDGNRCSGCRIDISKAAIEDVKIGKCLVKCENCGRIIFIKNNK